MPRDTSTRPGAPRTIFGLFAPWTATSAHESSSRPFSTRMSARRSFSMRLGRISISWAFCVPRASDSTSTRLPPTSSVSALRSGIVATTWILSAAEAAGSIGPMTARAAPSIRIARRMCRRLLEGGRGMGAEDDRGLEKELVHGPRAAAVEIEAVTMSAVRALVRRPEAEELGRPETDVGLERPLGTWILRVLRPVDPQTAGPAPPRLDLAAHVPAPAVPVFLIEGIGHAVAVGVDVDVELPPRVEPLSRQGDERMEPAVRAVLVAAFPTQDRAGKPLGGLAAGDRHAELDRVLVAELEERAEPARDERSLEGGPAEGSLVVAIEHTGERFDVEVQVGDERHFDPLFLEPLAAEEVAHHVRAVDPRQVVLVDLVRIAEAVAHLAEPGLGAKRECEQRDVGLGQVHAGISAPRFLPGFDPHDRRRIGIDLAEEAQLDLAWEEAILLAGEGPALGLLDVLLGKVAHEVAGDADVEQELACPPLLIEAERLPRPREVDRREPGRSRRRRSGGGGNLSRGRRLGFQALQPLGHRL